MEKGRRADARQSGAKRGSPPRTKLKSIGCNSGGLKTILYQQRSIGKAVFDEAGGTRHNIIEAAPNELKIDEGG